MFVYQDRRCHVDRRRFEGNLQGVDGQFAGKRMLGSRRATVSTFQVQMGLPYCYSSEEFQAALLDLR